MAPGKYAACLFSIAAAAALSACATPSARDFGGRWQPVNRFDTAPQAIPLRLVYEYFASPLDGTLKTMLARWARDTGMVLSWQWPDDYTLFTPVSEIRTRDVRAATGQLASIYAPLGVSVTVRGREILVAPAPTPAPATSAVDATGTRVEGVHMAGASARSR
ncbi:MAG: hypothetical protein ACREPF_08325 [Rhodanobacteraceae bacterium]